VADFENIPVKILPTKPSSKHFDDGFLRWQGQLAHRHVGIDRYEGL